MWRFAIVFLIASATLGGQTARLHRLPQGEAIAITGVTVVDVVAGRLIPFQTVVIRNQRLAAVGPSRGGRLPRNTRVVDGIGKYLIPGLWDMHVHALRAGRATWMFPLFIAAGVTGIRDTGSPLDTLLLYRTRVGSREMLGPRIVGTGPLLDGPGGPWSTFAIPVESPARGRRVVDSLADAGVNFIKVYNGLSRDAFFAIADEARRRGVPIVGHVPGSVGAMEASQAGMKSIEHLTQVPLACVPDSIGRALGREISEHANRPGMTRDSMQALQLELIGRAAAAFSETLCERTGARFARNGTWQVPTHERLKHWSRAFLGNDTAGRDTLLRYVPRQVRSTWRHYQDSILALGPLSDAFPEWYPLASRVIRSLHRGGDGILAGTDTDGNDANIYGVPGIALHRELEALVRDAGLTPLEALRAATLNPARFLNATDSLGTIEQGKLADLVLLDGNPLDDIRYTQKIRAVVANGRYFDRAALNALLAQPTRDPELRH